jgi:Fe-S cluster assembly iron-binding protein IscA
MALDESTEGLEELQSNGISAFIDPKLNEYLSQIGDIAIDYISNEQGSGYTIKVGDPQSRCGVSGCSC